MADRVSRYAQLDSLGGGGELKKPDQIHGTLETSDQPAIQAVIDQNFELLTLDEAIAILRG